MLIKEETIQAIKDRTDIADIIMQFVKLKKHGANLIGLCPFHNEKSGSFTVSPQRQIYKCFGCGRSGDAISFIQEHDKKTYPEAIEWLGSYYNIAIELQEEEPGAKEKREAVKNQKELLINALQLAQDKYTDALLKNTTALTYLHERGITDEVMQFWGIGYAPDEWQFISHDIINRNLYQPGIDAGIIKTKDGKTYDFLRNRITIPIHDAAGNLVALAGRWLPTGDTAKDDAHAKYLNTCESIAYKKSEVLFGMYQALQAKAFKKENCAFLTEGYFDVISMHEAGAQNTVAPCNSMMTDAQLKLLQRHTDHFIFLIEDEASQTAVSKSINECLRNRIAVEIISLYKKEKKDGKEKTIKCDADEYARQWQAGLPLAPTDE
ncbi:MAG TPA: DNA primase [Chitinophagaceae bacterium]|nr:DNA primase [Chitinophagaceae bacterium]